MKQITYAVLSLITIFIVNLFLSPAIGVYAHNEAYTLYSTIVVWLVGIYFMVKNAPLD
jgi:hypothetical protein